MEDKVRLSLSIRNKLRCQPHKYQPQINPGTYRISEVKHPYI